MHRHYKKWVLRFYRGFRHPRRLKQSPMMRWFARHFLDKSVWKPTRHTFAGGLAIGLFIMMLMLPGQMTVAAFIAALLRVNIPIAMAACWITNPLTFVPVTWWEIKLGIWLMDVLGFDAPAHLGWMELKSFVHDSPGVWEFFIALKPWAWSLYLGGLASGAILALIGYALSFMLWDLMTLLTHRRNQDKAATLP